MGWSFLMSPVDFIVKTLKSWLLPAGGGGFDIILQLIAIALTMVWILRTPIAKTIAGKLSVIPIVIAVIALAIPIAKGTLFTVWGILPWYGKLIVGIVVIFGFKVVITSVLSFAGSGAKSLWGWTKETIMKKEDAPSILQYVGAIFVAGFINSAAINAKFGPIPMILSALFGAYCLIGKERLKGQNTRYKDGYIPAVYEQDGKTVKVVAQYRCGHIQDDGICGELNPMGPDGEFPEECQGCGQPLLNAPWRCACGEIISSNKRYCKKCGNKRQKKTEKPAAMPEKRKDVCDFCSTPFPSGTTECPNCAAPPPSSTPTPTPTSTQSPSSSSWSRYGDDL